MNAWTALAIYYVLALAIASGVMVHAGWLQQRRPETRKVLPKMFPWLDEQRTYANAVSIARYSLANPSAWAVWVFASAPAVAAIATSLVGDGEAGTAEVVRRLQPWSGVDQRGAIVTYVAIAIVFVVVSAVYLSVASAATEGRPAILRDRSRSKVWALLLGGTLVDEGGLLEELGWRGFALPVLAVSMGSSWWATAVVAVGWWAWHLPREVPGLLRTPVWRRFVKLQGQFLGLCCGLSAIMTVAWIHTGSVWPAVLIHGGTNVWSKALGGPMWARTNKDVRSSIVTIVAVLAVAFEVLL